MSSEIHQNAPQKLPAHYDKPDLVAAGTTDTGKVSDEEATALFNARYDSSLSVKEYQQQDVVAKSPGKPFLPPPSSKADIVPTNEWLGGKTGILFLAVFQGRMADISKALAGIKLLEQQCKKAQMDICASLFQDEAALAKASGLATAMQNAIGAAAAVFPIATKGLSMFKASTARKVAEAEVNKDPLVGKYDNNKSPKEQSQLEQAKTERDKIKTAMMNPGEGGSVTFRGETRTPAQLEERLAKVEERISKLTTLREEKIMKKTEEINKKFESIDALTSQIYQAVDKALTAAFEMKKAIIEGQKALVRGGEEMNRNSMSAAFEGFNNVTNLVDTMQRMLQDMQRTQRELMSMQPH